MAFDVSVITLFPDAFPGLLDVSILGRAREQGLRPPQVVATTVGVRTATSAAREIFIAK